MSHSVTVKFRYENDEGFEVSIVKDFTVRRAKDVATAKIKAVKDVVAHYPATFVDVIEVKLI